MSRRFPPPWAVRELQESFVVEDATGFPVAYTYFEDGDAARRRDTRRMTKDEARRIADTIARQPELSGNEVRLMPHYQFAAVFNGSRQVPVGEFLIDDATARLHAIQVIRELKSNRNSTFYSGWSMRVTKDERQIAMIPFDECK